MSSYNTFYYEYMKNTLIIILALILVGGGAWALSGVFFGNKEEAPVDVPAGAPFGEPEGGEAGIEQETGVTVEEGRAVLALLNDLRSLSLDETFFSNRIFMSLEDWSVVLVPEPMGRANPFAPIGQDTTSSPL